MLSVSPQCPRLRLASRARPSRLQRVWAVALLIALCAGLGAAPAAAQSGSTGVVLYVSESGSDANAGTSWTDAYRTLQQALSVASANSGTEIWIAAGTYYPDEGPGLTNDDPTASFQMVDGVDVYGGFAGTESARSARDAQANPTVLSGDVDGNDTDPDGDGIVASPFDISGTNSYHVVSALNAANGVQVDGLIITGGNAAGTTTLSQGQGGGLYLSASTVRAANVILTGNGALEGGAAYVNFDSDLTLVNSLVAVNTASSGSAFVNQGPLTLTNTLLVGHVGSPAAISAESGVFLQNVTATGNDGLVATTTNAGVTAQNTILWGNASGGAQLQTGDSDSSVSLNHVLIQGGVSAGVDTFFGGFVSTATAVLDADPFFASPAGPDGVPGTLDDNFRLLSISPAVDAGNATLLALDETDADRDGDFTEPVSVDLDGEARVQDAAPDLGAYEGGEPPLTLLSTIPDRESATAGPTDPVSLTFDRPVDGASLGTATVQVRGSQSGIASGTLAGGGTSTVTFTPAAPFRRGETVTVTLAPGLLGIDGVPLALPKQTAYTVSSAPSAGFLVDSAAGIPGARQGDLDWGDYDADGDLDVAVTGQNSAGNPSLRIYRNDGTAGFTDVSSGLSGVTRSSVDWGDYDADGDLDLLVTGSIDGTSSGASTTLYRNDGGDQFSVVTSGLPDVGIGDAVWGDYDGDGFLDVFITGRDPNGLPIAAIYQNTGGGSFAGISAGLTPVDFSTGAWGDLDGDRDPDLVVVGGGSTGPVSIVYRNDGGGIFTEQPAGFTGVSRGDVDLTDLNGDGLLDVFVVGQDADGLPFSELYQNAGGGSFNVLASGLPGRSFGATAAFGDVDGDGDRDALVAGRVSTSSYGADLFTNDGTGVFTNAGLSLPAVAESAAAFGDVEGDGDLDLLLGGTQVDLTRVAAVFANVAPPAISVSSALGSIADGTTLSLGVTDPGTALTESFTVSNDPGAEADLVISTADPSNTDFFSLTPPSPLPVTIPPGGSATFDLTLAASSEGFYTTAVELGSNDLAQSPFVFFAEASVAAPAISEVRPSSGAPGTPVRIRGGGLGSVSSLTFGGVEATVDSVSVNGRVVYARVPAGPSGTVDVSVSLGSGFSGTLPSAFTVATGGPGFFQAAAPTLAAQTAADGDWADYDNDGDLDLFLTGADATATPVSTLYRNDGGFSLVDTGISFPALERGSVSWGDYDRDGDPDLFLSGLDATSTPQSVVLRNDGAGVFVDIGAGLTPVRDGGSDWGDFDGDGDLDLAVTGVNGSGSRTSRIYEQVDPGVFSALSASLSPAAQGDVIWGDLNGDGLPDLILADGSGGGVDVYENAGSGLFTSVSTSLPTLPLQTADLGDVDGDGDLDLLAAGGEPGTSASADLFLNDGTGTFTAQSAGFVPVEQSHGRFGDLDGDGDLDVVVTGVPTGTSQTQEARVYRNDGGTFVSAGGRLPEIAEGITAWADADQDGDLDLLLAGNGTAEVFENRAPPALTVTAGGSSFTEPPAGAVLLGSTPVATDGRFPVVIENTAGTADGATLIVDNIAPAGDAALSLDAVALPLEIAPGATAAVDVLVDGSTAGTVTGSVDLQTNAPGGTSFSLPVEARVLDAVTVTGTPVPVPFGTVELGSGFDAIVTLSNPNLNTPVTITNLQIQGTNPGDFDVQSALPLEIPAATNVNLALLMTPKATGARSAELAVQAEAGGAAFPLVTVPLEGSGTTGTTPALDFGVVEANAGSQAQTQTVTNFSNLNILFTLPDVRIEGANAAQFAITNAPAPSTEFGTSADIEVTFQPTADGPKAAELVVEKQLAGFTTVAVERIPLQGDAGSAPIIPSTGTPASITTTTADVAGDVAPGGASTAVEFQAVPAGTPFGGTGMLTFAAAESPLTGFTTATASATLTGLSPNTEYDVRLAATNTFGTATGTPQTFLTQSIPVSLSPTSPIGLGPVTQGGLVDQTVTVSNDGSTAISGLTLTQTAGGADVTILNGITSSIAAGSSDTVTLRFAPTSTGVQTASFDVTGTGIQPVTIDLSGEGVLLAPSVTPATADLGTVAVGTAASATFTFENPGTDGALADGLTLTQTAGSADFTILNDILASVGVGSTDSFVIEATPSAAGTQTATFEITGTNVAPVTVDVTVTGESPNQAPTPAADAYTTDADEALAVGDPAQGVLANDTDPDTDALTATVDTAPSSGSLTLNSDGTFTYTPAAGFTGTDSFTYIANDGTTGASATVTVSVVDRGAFVHALDFATAETDRVDLPAPVPTGAVTYSAWVYPRSLSGTYNTILEFGNDSPWFGVGSGGVLDFWPNGSSAVRGGVVPLNQWTHVAYTWDGTTHRLYVDGRLVGTSPTAFTAPNSPSGGLGANQGDTPWDGVLDDVAVWTRARTQAEIQADLAGLSPTALADPDLAGYFAFDGRRQDVRNAGTALADGVLGSTRQAEADDPQRVAALDGAPLPEVAGIAPTVPGSGTAVEPSTAFEITLSAAVSPVDASTVGLESATRGLLAATRTGAGTTTLTLTPDAPLAPGDRVTVRVTDGAADANGRAVAPVAETFFVQPAVGSAFFAPDGAGLGGVQSSSGTWADVDGDGDLDVLLTGEDGSGTVGAVLYENTGGSFAARTGSGLEAVNARSVDWADVDGDGDLDAAVASHISGGRTADVYLNDGTGTFSALGAGLDAVEGGAAAFGDVDGDGAPDLLLTGLNSSGVRIATVYLNTPAGTGSFSPLNAGLTGVRLGGGAWADMDDDGDLDLAITGLDSGGVYTASIYRNDEGTFTSLNAGLTGVRFGTPAWGDVDGDGDPDLVVPGETSAGTATTTVYRNGLNAGTGFTPVNPDANGTTAGLQGTGRFGWAAAAWGDADGDGDLDLALSGRDADGNVGDVFLNDGTGAFTPAGTGVPAANNGSVAWGDADADGDLDLLVTGTASGAPIAQVAANVAPPAVQLSEGGSAVAAGEVRSVGNTPEGTDLSTTLTVANPVSAEADLVIDGATVADAAYTLTLPAALPIAVAPGASVDLTLTLSGASAGTYTTAVTLSTNDPAAPSFSFTAEGTVTSTTAPPVLYVSMTGSDAADGTSWSTAFRTLQQALATAQPGAATEIWVAAGTYYPDEGPGLTNDDRTATFALVDGVDVYGGFAGSEGARALRNSQANPTILSGDVDGNDLDPDGDGIVASPLDVQGSNSLHVVTASGLSTGVRLDGVIVTGGTADGTTAPDGSGGGLLVSSAGTFVGSNLLLAGNQAVDGSAAFFQNTTASLVGSFVVANLSTAGSTLRMQGGTLQVVNGLVGGNRGGQAVFTAAGTPLTLQQTTVTRNDRPVAAATNASVTVQNSILWGNGTGAQIVLGDSDSFADLQNVLLQGGIATGVDESAGGFVNTATGVQTADPRFANPAGPDGTAGTLDDDFRLLATSPAVEAGDAALLPVDAADVDRDGNATESLPLDLDGELRVQEARPDLGAYEGGEPVLIVTGTVPARNSVTAPLGDPVSIVFDRPVNAATVTPATASIRGDLVGARSFAVSGDGTTTLTLTPTPAFLPGETVTVRLGAAVAATDGTPLGAGTQIAFTAAASTSAGTFVDAGAGLTGVQAGDAAWADVDADGVLELAVVGADAAGNPVAGTLYENDGAGALSASTALPALAGSRMDWGDADGDGDLDLLVIGETSAGTLTAAVYPNDGTGTLGTPTSAAPGVRDGAALWMDADADGDLDALVIGRDGDGFPTAVLSRNDGTGRFTPSATSLPGRADAGAAAGDLNGDGTPDLILAGGDSDGLGTAAVYLNDGTGRFTPVASPGLVGVTAAAVALGDLDGDGDLDAALSGREPGPVDATRIYTNDGTGTFADVGGALPGTAAGALAWGDANGDGALDLVLTGSLQASIAQGDGTGGFAVGTAGLFGVQQSAAALADADADGDLDLAVTGNDGSAASATLYRNAAAPQVAVSTGGTALANGQATAVNLGTAGLGTDLTQTFTLANTGTESGLTVQGVTASNTDFYTAIPAVPAPFTLAPGETATFDVTLRGATAGTQTSTITVESDDPDDGAFAFPVTGTIADAAPTVAVNAGLTLDQGGTATLDTTLLQAADTDTPDGSLVFTLTTAPANGTLQANGTALTVGGTFTQADLNAAALSYGHDGSATTTDAFAFTVTDGTSTTAEATFSITLNAVNAAPSISSIAGPTIDEDTGTGALPFIVSDSETAAADLTLAATTDAPGLLPDANLTLTGPDADGNATITAVPAPDSSGTATVTVTVSDGSATATSSFPVTVTPVNDAPAITAISDRIVQEDASLGAAAFSVSDAESSAADLTITATSDNSALLPDSNLTLTGPDVDGNASLAAVPAADGNGSTGIAVTVSDGSATSTARFTLTVSPVNDEPTISTLSDQTIQEDATLGPISFTLADVDTPVEALTVTATSTAPDVLPTANLQISGTGEARTLEGRPLPDSSGTATIDLAVSDANATVRTSFTVTVQAAPDPPTAVAEIPVGVTETAATLAGSVDPNDGETAVQFVYAPEGNPGAAATVQAVESPLAGSGAQSVQASVAGLQPDTRYTVRVEATNAAGSSTSDPVAFRTLNPLTVIPTASLGFGEVGVNSTRLRTVTLENTGADPLTVRGVAVSGASTFTVQDAGLPQTLDVGTTLNVDVEYAPTAVSGAETAELAITTDLENETLTLTGTSTAPPVARFGRIAVGPAVVRTLTVQNPLPRPITVQDLAVTDNADGVFAVGTDLVGQPIAAESAASVPVTLQSDASRVAEATLSVATDRGTQVIRLRTRAIGVTAQGSSDTPVPAVGQNAAVEITVPDAFQPTRVTLFYRPAGTTAYQTLDLTPSAALRKAGKAVLQAEIPAEAVTETGVQYYVEAVDAADGFRVTFPGTAPDVAPAGLPTEIPLVKATGPVAAETYRMYSVPVALREPVADLLQRRINFGPYDPVRWRAFRYPPSLDRRRSQNLTIEDVALQEFPGIDSLDVPGTAFWHVAAVEDSLRAVNARSADPSVPQTLRLQPGWNQIGNPFLFPVAWSTVIDSTLADPALDAAAREAVAALGEPVYWTGSDYRFGEAALAPWEGYFVYNPTPETPVHLTVPPVPAAAVDAPASVAALAAKQVAADPAEAYRVQLRTALRSEALAVPLMDAQNWIGILPGASDGRGPEDVAEAPPVGNYVRLSILRDGAPYDVLAGSFKAPGTEGHAWDVEVAARVEEPYMTRKTVTVDLLEEGPRPDGFNLYVLDLDERRMLPTEGSRVRLPLNRDRPRARLRVIAGTKAFAEQHSDGIAIGLFETRLRGNYPNPVAGDTRIVYELQKQSDVHLTVYDLLGRRIARLVEGKTQDAGPHEVVWNARLGGRPIASGVYFYRLRAGGVTDTGKLVVIR